MPRAVINKKTVNISDGRKNYMNGDHDSPEGKKQGEVLAAKDFAADVYTQNQFSTHQEMDIPLPTELLGFNRVDVDWEKIAKDLVASLGLVEKYGTDHVAYYVHYRDSESGRTTNDNLHVHVAYVDRTILEDKNIKLYQRNKKPHGINLMTGKNIKAKDFNENAPHHFLVEATEPKLDMKLVDKNIMTKFGKLAKKKNLSEEQLTKMGELKSEILKQAQSKSIGQKIYSNRIENEDVELLEFKLDTKNKRRVVADVLNGVCEKYDLKATIEKYGIYTGNTKEEDLEIEKLENMKEVDEYKADADVVIQKQLVEVAETKKAAENLVVQEKINRVEMLSDVIKHYYNNDQFDDDTFDNLMNPIGFTWNGEDWEFNVDAISDEKYFSVVNELAPIIANTPQDIVESAPPLTAKTVMGDKKPVKNQNQGMEI